MNGKGSDQRPRQVDKKIFEDNWDRIFGKKKTKKESKKKDDKKKQSDTRVADYRI